MIVSLLTPEYNEQYDAFVRQHNAAMLYYSLKFKAFLEKQTRAEALYYVALDVDNEIQGILPLMVKNGPYGKVLNSLPYYGSNGGVLANNTLAEKLLVRKYVDIVNSGEYAASTLISNPLSGDTPYNEVVCDETDYRIGQLTDISGNFGDLEQLMIKFDSKTRKNIRKAIKTKVKVAVENEQFGFLMQTHFDNMRAIGGLAKESSFFANVQASFKEGEDYNLYIARILGKPVAALLVFYFGKVVEYYTPVIVNSFRSHQPLSLIIAQAMLEASKYGYKWWNWGGTWQSQGGVYDFKSKWGTQDIHYNYHITIKNKLIYKAQKEDLLKHYGGFYVVPFNKVIA